MLRGWALLGVVLMNYTSLWKLTQAAEGIKHGILTNILYMTQETVFHGKSWTLLSILFGYGFAILLRNLAERNQNAAPFFARRMGWLLVLGFIDSAFYFGDFLKDYALLGFVFLLFAQFSARQAFRASLVLLLLIPFVSAFVATLPGGVGSPSEMNGLKTLYLSHNPLQVLQANLQGSYLLQVANLRYIIDVHLEMLACFFLGFAAQKADFFGRLSSTPRLARRIFWSSFAVVFVFSVILVSQRKSYFFTTLFKPNFWMVFSIMLLTASAICWLHQTRHFSNLFKSLQAMGRMTLTNYLVQNLLMLLIFSGFGLAQLGKQPLVWHVGIAWLIFILQVWFSQWWLARYQYGPVEWVWRQLSYGQRLPLRRQEPVDDSLAVSY
ncbi:DUF418 domain-containing protein [Hymenobacter sp. DG25A]|uniref:DUF418 domain-containing protein n=1 Tax=Hymenobacter sp. DG25A TaxID=1385663 RepID=UPI0018D0EF98|nr:DUF418 domain-containing protein [Hymenobacter sp. DG25A]